MVLYIYDPVRDMFVVSITEVKMLMKFKFTNYN
jgi:hypothetical protein